MSMWVLMYVFSYSVNPAATNDRAEWRLLPTVVFQEFTSEDSEGDAGREPEGRGREAETWPRRSEGHRQG
jgi:hypothetical protein